MIPRLARAGRRRDNAAMQADFFVTCLVDSFFPEVGRGAAKVLARAGVRLELPPAQTCCGQPLFNAGLRVKARRQALRTLDLLEPREVPVILPSGSCAHMIRHGIPELLRDDPTNLERALRLARRSYELSEFLWEKTGWQPRPVSGAPRYVYHASCHLQRGLGVDDAPRRMLAMACGQPGAVLDPECCGFGGVFSVEHPEISEAMLARRLAQIEASGAERVVGCDVSCLMHLEGGLRRAGSPVRCLHLAQALIADWGGLR
jgi:L-lactate dehydrogenase complex protein LldE